MKKVKRTKKFSTKKKKNKRNKKSSSKKEISFNGPKSEWVENQIKLAKEDIKRRGS